MLKSHVISHQTYKLSLFPIGNKNFVFNKLSMRSNATVIHIGNKEKWEMLSF